MVLPEILIVLGRWQLWHVTIASLLICSNLRRVFVHFCLYVMNKFSIDRDGSIAAFVRNFLGVMGICQQACVTWDAPIFELFLEKFQLSGVSTFWDLLSI